MDSGQPPSMSSAMKSSDQDQFQIGAQINQPWLQPQSVDHPLPGPNYYDYLGDGQPPSVGDMRPVVISHPSGSRDLMSVDGQQPPSLNDVGGRRASQTGGSLAGGGNQIFDQQALVGMSLVGNNFKKMYPMAYQK